MWGIPGVWRRVCAASPPPQPPPGVTRGGKKGVADDLAQSACRAPWVEAAGGLPPADHPRDGGTAMWECALLAWRSGGRALSAAGESGTRPALGRTGTSPGGVSGGQRDASRTPQTALWFCSGEGRVPAARVAWPPTPAGAFNTFTLPPLPAFSPPHIPSGRRSAGRALLTTRGLFSVRGTRFFGRRPRLRSLTCPLASQSAQAQQGGPRETAPRRPEVGQQPLPGAQLRAVTRPPRKPGNHTTTLLPGLHTGFGPPIHPALLQAG